MRKTITNARAALALAVQPGCTTSKGLVYGDAGIWTVDEEICGSSNTRKGYR